ncbi:uncharacterized protein LOC144096559 [Amblyomma americanum]|uniref:Secreted protein n=1 Tax=Amblyomma americanum TaxID=6943 RepID=A0AAQ4F1M0_AMBAM
MAPVGKLTLRLLLVVLVAGLGVITARAQEQAAEDNQQAQPAARSVIVAESAGVPLLGSPALAPASHQEYVAAQPAATYDAVPRSRLRRTALSLRRRRRLDNPRYYYPNGDYSADTEISWDNYHRRAAREYAEAARRPDSYQASYAAPLEPEAERFKADEGHREADYGAAGYDYRSGYQRQGYQKQRRAAMPPLRQQPEQWGLWQQDYGTQGQQSLKVRYPQYDYGEAAAAYARKDPSSFYAREEAASRAEVGNNIPPSNYAAEVVGQDGVVERAGDVPVAAAAK